MATGESNSKFLSPKIAHGRHGIDFCVLNSINSLISNMVAWNRTVVFLSLQIR